MKSNYTQLFNKLLVIHGDKNLTLLSILPRISSLFELLAPLSVCSCVLRTSIEQIALNNSALSNSTALEFSVIDKNTRMLPTNSSGSWQVALLKWTCFRHFQCFNTNCMACGLKFYSQLKFSWKFIRFSQIVLLNCPVCYILLLCLLKLVCCIGSNDDEDECCSVQWRRGPSSSLRARKARKGACEIVELIRCSLPKPSSV